MRASNAMTRCASSPVAESDGMPAPDGSRSTYRFGARPMRLVALAATVALHLAVGAVVVIGWQWREPVHGQPHLTSIVVLPRPADEPRRKPASGTPASAQEPEPLPVASNPAPTIVLAEPIPAAVHVPAELPVSVEGGREDALATITQVYRRRIMEKLEAQRSQLRIEAARYREGTGLVFFRVERSGRLLEAAVAQSTGSSRQDRAALAIVRRAAPFPPIPDALPDELAITLPVEFLISGHAPELAAR